jgi:RNA recognition motif-containing protein
MNYSFKLTQQTQITQVTQVTKLTQNISFNMKNNAETNENKNTSNVNVALTSIKNKSQSSIKERCVKFNEELQKMHNEQKEMDTMLYNIELINIPMSHEPHPCGNGMHAALYIKGKCNKKQTHHYR